MNTFEFIDVIKKRPAMYVYTESVSELDGLLRGFHYARSISSEIGSDEKNLFNDFTKWLQEKKYTTLINLNISWRSILLFNHVSEYRAFLKFFELWEEYKIYLNKM